MFVNVDEPRNGRLMEYFRVRGFEAPLVRLVNMTDHVTYHLPYETLDAGTIKRFCQSYLEGKAKVDPTSVWRQEVSPPPPLLTSCGSVQPKMQSEPIPEGWDQQPVKELVGMNLEEVAFNPDKTVFLMFCM